jgi:hypothetical protein
VAGVGDVKVAGGGVDGERRWVAQLEGSVRAADHQPQASAAEDLVDGVAGGRLGAEQMLAGRVVDEPLEVGKLVVVHIAALPAAGEGPHNVSLLAAHPRINSAVGGHRQADERAVLSATGDGHHFTGLRRRPPGRTTTAGRCDDDHDDGGQPNRDPSHHKPLPRAS